MDDAPARSATSSVRDRAWKTGATMASGCRRGARLGRGRRGRRGRRAVVAVVDSVVVESYAVDRGECTWVLECGRCQLKCDRSLDARGRRAPRLNQNRAGSPVNRGHWRPAPCKALHADRQMPRAVPFPSSSPISSTAGSRSGARSCAPPTVFQHVHSVYFASTSCAMAHSTELDCVALPLAAIERGNRVSDMRRSTRGSRDRGMGCTRQTP